MTRAAGSSSSGYYKWKLAILVWPSPRLRRSIYVIGGMFVVAGHNTVDPRCALTSIAHSHTLIEEGPRMRNTEAVRLFPVQVVGEADILLLLQSGNDRFLIHRIRLGELYAINWLISKNRINYCLTVSRAFGEVVGKTKKGKSWTP